MNFLALVFGLALTLPTDHFTMEKVPDKILRECAVIVNVPYASDNLTDDEWMRFKDCARMKMDERR